MKTKNTKVILSVLIVFAFIITLFSTLYSYPTGITGLTYRTGGQGCSCHGSSPTPSVTVSFLNADSVGKGQTKTITVKIQGGSAVAGGFNVAVLNGILNVGSDAGVQKIGSELTHVSPRSFSSGSVTWTFNYTAPNTAGWDTLYAVGNSVNLNGGNSGDTWNFLVRFPVKIYNTTSIRNENEVVENYELKQNYPNPFNPTTNIKFTTIKDGFVSLKVYDITGKEVATLVNSNMKSGAYVVDFNASGLSSGLYIYKLTSNDFTSTKKMTLVK
ncbi:MAG: T9SS type A sorting domain-containing protein [Ignavibacteriae bacterium]|nr:T9SS type A sorting domain-containing protein [Ignavibacteriota bacterium]